MRWLGELYRRLLVLVRRRRLERDLDDEIAFHLSMREAEHRRSGLTPREATITARRQFGNPTNLKEETRDAWLFSSFESWLQDVRFAGRSLRRSPGFALVAVLTLALAVGVTTAMFTLLDALILRPVPFRAPDDLSFIYMGTRTGGRGTVAPAVFRAWRENPAFAGAESASPDTALIEANGVVATRGIARVSPGIFDLLGGVRPVRGRLFDTTEGRPGTNDRVILSEDLWRTLYHANPSIVGRRVTIDGESLAVVGILPSDFRFPRWNTEIWRAFDFTSPTTQAASFPMVYVRFAANMPRADALRLARDAARASDSRNAKLEPLVRPLATDMLDPYYRRAVPLLAGGVVLVFLVLCANTSSLLLARLAERRREFSMRSALGASRGRVMRQAFVESGVIGALGVVVGTRPGVGAHFRGACVSSGSLAAADAQSSEHRPALARNGVGSRRRGRPRCGRTAGVDWHPRRSDSVAARVRARRNRDAWRAERHAWIARRGDSARVHTAGRSDVARAIFCQSVGRRSRARCERGRHRVDRIRSPGFSRSGRAPARSSVR